MKDYSINIEERKDFILGYEVTKKGQIKVKFAKGKPWFLPYNEENEKIILDKMEKQLEKSNGIKIKTEEKLLPVAVVSAVLFAATIILVIQLVGSYNTYVVAGISSLPMVSSLITGFFAVKNKIKLNDLKKNVKFLKMKDKLNKVVRTDDNILVDVSAKTKNVVKAFSEEKEIFNINSFNFVPFKDLEQIMENDSRNEKFGFNYDVQEEVKGFVKKRIR